MDMVALITLWQAHNCGVAETLRGAAMEEQEENGFARRDEFIAAAEQLGFNGKTAAVCWAYVKRQEAS